MRLSEKNMEASTSSLRWMEREERPEIPYILKSNLQTFYSFIGLKNQMQIIIMCGLDLRPRAGFWKNDKAAVRAVRTILYDNLSQKNVKTASSISENRPFLGPVNFLHDASHLLIAVLCFRHSRTLFSSAPKNCSGFVVSLLLCALNNFTFELCRV
jgi:hypothetical protein